MSSEEKKKNENKPSETTFGVVVDVATDVAIDSVFDTSYLDVVGDVFTGLGDALGSIDL